MKKYICGASAKREILMTGRWPQGQNMLLSNGKQLSLGLITVQPK